MWDALLALQIIFKYIYYVIFTSAFIGINFLLTIEISKNDNKQPPLPKKQIKQPKTKTKGIRDMGLWDNAHTSR